MPNATLEEVQSPIEAARVATELAHVRRLQGKMSSAILLLEEAISVLGDSDPAQLGQALREMAVCFGEEDGLKAEKLLRRSIELFEQSDECAKLAASSRALGDVLRDRAELDGASDLLVKGAGMSKWEDKKIWAGLVDGSTCPICNAGQPLWVLLEMQASWVTAPNTAPSPGYVCLVSKRHVVEPFQLPAAEQQMWWRDVMVAAEALTELLGTPKMNYEIHGNTIPHLHIHLFPRMKGDPYVGGPIDPRLAAFTRSQQDLERLRQAIEAKQGGAFRS